MWFPGCFQALPANITKIRGQRCSRTFPEAVLSQSKYKILLFQHYTAGLLNMQDKGKEMCSVFRNSSLTVKYLDCQTSQWHVACTCCLSTLCHVPFSWLFSAAASEETVFKCGKHACSFLHGGSNLGLQGHGILPGTFAQNSRRRTMQHAARMHYWTA